MIFNVVLINREFLKCSRQAYVYSCDHKFCLVVFNLLNYDKIYQCNCGFHSYTCNFDFGIIVTTHSVIYFHYENMPMQHRDFLAVKIENFQLKIFGIFLIFSQNIDCGYTLEPPRRGGSNEYPQSMFWSKNKKNRYTPAYPSFTI